MRVDVGAMGARRTAYVIQRGMGEWGDGEAGKVCGASKDTALVGVVREYAGMLATEVYVEEVGVNIAA